jgi:Protein of unknown function (DUF2804)
VNVSRPADLSRMPVVLDGRPRKRWRYVGVFGSRLMLCAGVVQIGPALQTFWAVWDRERQALRERTRLWRPRPYVRLPPGRVHVEDGSVSVRLSVGPGTPIEASSVGDDGGWLWTRKQSLVRFAGTVTLAGEDIVVDALGCIDESAGYHDRLTQWEWSAGVGVLEDGRDAGWNLVRGIHDGEIGSERAVWVAGSSPVEVGPVVFAADLSSVGGLSFTPEATRERHDAMGPFRSDYVQPFGTFTGTLPGGLQLREGRGVMERHSALW